jgi:hypothetical protein
MEAAITVAIIAATTSIVTLIVTSFYRHKELQERKRAERRNQIFTSLNDFYGPIVSYLNIVKTLNAIFRLNKPKEFRVLTYLMNPNQTYDTETGNNNVTLNAADELLLEEIIDTERKIEDLILTKSGLIDDERLMFNYIPDPTITDVNPDKTSLIVLAVAHFRILRMAYKGHFLGESERFGNLVYPRELDIQLQKKILELQEEFNTL